MAAMYIFISLNPQPKNEDTTCYLQYNNVKFPLIARRQRVFSVLYQFLCQSVVYLLCTVWAENSKQMLLSCVWIMLPLRCRQVFASDAWLQFFRRCFSHKVDIILPGERRAAVTPGVDYAVWAHQRWSLCGTVFCSTVYFVSRFIVKIPVSSRK